MYICVYIYIYICIQIHTPIDKYAYVCMYIYIYIRHAIAVGESGVGG